MRGSTDPKKAIRLIQGLWIARTPQQRISGNRRTREQKSRVTVLWGPKLARCKQLPTASVRVLGRLEER
jgi:hypothetical protein